MSGLSDALVYSTKPSGVPARKITQGFQSWNGAEFSGGQVIKININGRSNQYLNQKMSYLQLKFKPAADCKLDYTINSIIKEISLYQGTAKLERITNYNVLWHMVNDMMSAEHTTVYSDNILLGADADNVRRGRDLTANTEYVFCIPLMSSILGGGCPKMLPLAFTNDLRLEILLEDNSYALITNGTDTVAPTATTTYTVSEVQFVAELVELDPAVQAMIEQQVAQTGGYRISIEQWHNFACNSPNVTGNSILVGGRFSSVKTLLAAFRYDSQRTTDPYKKATITHRVNPFTGSDVARWFWKCAHHKFPDNEVKNDVQAYAESIKAFHNLSQEVPGLAVYNTWVKSSSTCDLTKKAIKDSATALTTGTYLLAVDTESQSHKSASLAAAGLNTAKNDMYLEYTINSANKDTYDVQVFVHTDNWLTIRDGLIIIED
jgi:hypothetical protein